jgi:hypothetical protein
MKNTVDWAMVGGVAAIAAVVIALAALGVAIATYFSQRKKKRIEYEVTTTPIAAISTGQEHSRISILFDGKPVGSVYLSRLVIRNVGNVPIRPEDFVETISITTEPQGRLLQVEGGIEGEAPWLIPTPNNIVTYDHRLLLNGGEALVFSIIHSTNGFPEIRVRARVAGAEFREHQFEVGAASLSLLGAALQIAALMAPYKVFGMGNKDKD